MRRFNYTNRQRIARRDVRIATRQADGGRMAIDAQLDLSWLRQDAGVSQSAQVYVEAYHRSLFERVSLGTVAHPQRVSGYELQKFRHDQHVVFRVKVVDPETGRLVAFGRDIRAGDEDEQPRRSLLAVTVAPLDGVVYKVEFPEGEAPILTLNERLDAVAAGGMKAFAHDHMFVSLVYPAVVKEILVKVLIVDELSEEDLDDDCVEAKWLAYAKRLNPEALPGAEETQSRFDWIDKATEQVGGQLDAVKRFALAVSQEQ